MGNVERTAQMQLLLYEILSDLAYKQRVRATKRTEWIGCKCEHERYGIDDNGGGDIVCSLGHIGPF